VSANEIQEVYSDIDHLLNELRIARPPRSTLLRAEIHDLRKRLEGLALDPGLPLPVLVVELQHGRGWDNPALALYLLADPLLSASVAPYSLLIGLSTRCGVTAPVGALIDLTHYGQWGDLALALHRASQKGST